jgi:hypothetical protein
MFLVLHLQGQKFDASQKSHEYVDVFVSNLSMRDFMPASDRPTSQADERSDEPAA